MAMNSSTNPTHSTHFSVSDFPTPMQALKRATQTAHTQLEALAIPESGLADMPLNAYRELIIHNYQLHCAYEPALVHYLDSELPELAYGELRRKLPALEQDLIALDLNPEHWRWPEQSVLNLPEALGSTYVLEGATLGGQMIRRALLKQPVFAERFALHYYGLYAEQLRDRWLSFMTLVNQELSQPEDINMACESANRTFKLAAQIFARPVEILA